MFVDKTKFAAARRPFFYAMARSTAAIRVRSTGAISIAIVAQVVPRTVGRFRSHVRTI